MIRKLVAFVIIPRCFFLIYLFIYYLFKNIITNFIFTKLEILLAANIGLFLLNTYKFKYLIQFRGKKIKEKIVFIYFKQLHL